MQSYVVTQTISQEPRVLVVGIGGRLTAAVIRVLNELSLQVISLSQSQEGWREQLQVEEWYRLIWVIESPLESKFLEVLESISKVTVPITVVFGGVTPVTSRDESLDDWVLATKNQGEYLEKIEQKLPAAAVVVIGDLLQLHNPPWSSLVHQITQQFVVDPRVVIRPLDIQSVQLWLKDELLKPVMGRKTWVVGQSVATEQVVSLIQQEYRQLHGITVLRREIPQVNTLYPSRGFEKVELFGSTSSRTKKKKYSAPPLSQLITELVRSLPSPQYRESEEWFENQILVAPQKTVENSIKPRSEKKKVVGEVGEVPQYDKTSVIQENLNNTDKSIKNEYSSTSELEAKTPVQTTLRSLFSRSREEERSQHLHRLVEATQKGNTKSKNRRLLFVGGLSMSGLALGVLVLALFFRFAQNNVKTALWSLYLSRVETTSFQEHEKSLRQLKSSSTWLKNQVAVYSGLMGAGWFGEAAELIQLSEEVVGGEKAGAALLQETSVWYQQLWGTQPGDAGESMVKMGRRVGELYKTLSMLAARLKGADKTTLTSTQVNSLEGYQVLLSQEQQRLGQLQQLSPILSPLLGGETRRVHAVLLQNEQELRPTGGFIQAVALLTLEQGKIISVEVMDVYQIDRQLTAALVPPNEIKQFLNEQQWYLRDSNWSPDFPETAQRVRWFLDKSLSKQVDGVIGLNLKSLALLIKAVGPVELPEYNEVLTEDNIRERFEFHSEVQLIDDGLKPDYSELVLSRVLEKLKVTQEPEKIAQVLDALYQSLEKKELFVTLVDPSEGQTLSSLGWTGELLSPNCPSVFVGKNCVVDGFMQVDANVGVNKVNTYIQRQIEHSIRLDSGAARHSRVIQYKNTAASTGWPKGNYRVYSRFYLDSASKLESIAVNNAPLPMDQITVSQEKGKQVYGVLLDIPIQSELKIEVAYSKNIDTSGQFSYVFFDQKQPGASTITPRVFMSFSPTLSPTLIAPQAEVQGNVIVFSPSRDQGHLIVGATFE